jgi:hypothetical protein
VRRIVALAAVAVGAAFALAACGGGVDPGVSSGDDLAAGKGLFLSSGQCGGCHTLADAGSTATIGPNLDDAFRHARADGFSDVTFEQVVREQMEIPAVIAPAAADGAVVNMPSRSELGLTEDQADDIAYYVATCAGLTPDEAAGVCPAAPPAPAPPPPPPADGETTAADGSASAG